ncbi:hypothetical protein, partial [Cellvibrio sp.]
KALQHRSGFASTGQFVSCAFVVLLRKSIPQKNNLQTAAELSVKQGVARMARTLNASIVVFCLYGTFLSFLYGNTFLFLSAAFGVFGLLAAFKGGAFLTVLKILSALSIVALIIILMFHYWFEPQMASTGSETYTFYESADETRVILVAVVPLVFLIGIQFLLFCNKRQA